MIVAIITEQKANEIASTEYVEGVEYNPINYSGKWFISLVEAQYLAVTDIVELKEAPNIPTE